MAKSSLRDPDTRSELLRLVGLGGPSGTIEAAAKAVGTSKSAVHRWAKTDEQFRADLAVARRRAGIVAHHAPRMLPATTDTPAGDTGETTTAYDDPCSPVGRARLYQMLWDHAEDGSSKGCPKSLDVLAQLAFAPEILAMQARAKREAAQLEQSGEKSTRPVVIRHGATRAPAVIDAEVLDDQSC